MEDGQLGCGLRHAPGKDYLQVLNFVAQMHKRYRVDRKFAALLPGVARLPPCAAGLLGGAAGYGQGTYFPQSGLGLIGEDSAAANMLYSLLWDTKGEQRGVGVLHFPEKKAYALLITLNKSDKDFSATTLYKDYPINLTHMHWESKSGTTQASMAGQNLINHAARGYSIYLFVRLNRSNGPLTAPLQFLVRGNRINFKGERPISLVWQLEHPMPPSSWKPTASAVNHSHPYRGFASIYQKLPTSTRQPLVGFVCYAISVRSV